MRDGTVAFHFTGFVLILGAAVWLAVRLAAGL